MGSLAMHKRNGAAYLLLGLLLVTLAAGCPQPAEHPERPNHREPPQDSMPPAKMYGYAVVEEFPHDTEAFTQGFVWDDGIFFEGTGMLGGRSTLRRIDPQTGDVLQSTALGIFEFGEGVAVFEDRIIQLTWRNRTGYVYDKDTFARIGDFPYTHEGWGVTHDGTQLIISDGTPTIRYYNPNTLTEVSSFQVLDEGEPVWRLNELEHIHGLIYANVWLTDRIAIIEPPNAPGDDGTVTGWIDLTGLLSPQDAIGADVLNGIAYDAENNRLFVTGKYWPKVFEIVLVPVEED